MKRLSFILLAVFLCVSCDATQDKVYVSTSKNAKKYHLSSSCSGLKKVKGLKTISLSQAKMKGLTVCKICEETYGSKTSTATTGSNVAVSKGPKYELARTASDRPEQVISHVGYTTSYNTSWLIPNWVAYDLTSREVNGTGKRPNKEFEPDPQVKGRSAVHRDYTNSGYSRGHMAPAADMKWSTQAMEESFYLSNVCPQNSGLNAGVWERLEGRVRALANENTVYVCCGPIVENTNHKIGTNKVVVPQKFFKVICMQRKGKWQAAGFIFTNTDCQGSMFNYGMSVDEVEKITHHDFFYNLPDNIENQIEASWRMKDWQ